jgi:hypothetical protein
MEADLKNIRFARTLKYCRLFAAFVLASLFIFLWLSFSLDIVMARFGMNPDGPAKIVLGMILLMLGFAAPVVCLLSVGLAYSFVIRTGRLNVSTVILAALPAALIYALIVYASMQPNRYPVFAWTMAATAAAGALLAAPVFYVIGIWRNTGKNHSQVRDLPSTDHPPKTALGDRQ